MLLKVKDDTERVKSAVDCDTIETNGSAIDTYTLEVIQHAQQTRGVIVLTDQISQVIKLEILYGNMFLVLSMHM